MIYIVRVFNASLMGVCVTKTFVSVNGTGNNLFKVSYFEW